MIKVKVFVGASIIGIEKINEFLETVKVIDVKYQMTDDNDCFMVLYDDEVDILGKVPTCKLIEELKKREGVITHEIAPNIAEYKISVKSVESNVENILSEEMGPAIILEVID